MTIGLSMEKNEELARKWHELALENMKMSELAASNGIYLQAMFHSQQSIEKTIKGLIVLVLKIDPPYSHDLVRLIRELKLEMNYSDSIVKVTKYINLSKEILSWLDQKMKS
jgi:HEPN domain-containing protein